MGSLMMSAIGDLRVHPVAKRVRASYGDLTVADSQRAKLVWEPRRVVASYAVPLEDVAGELLPFQAQPGDEVPVRMGSDGPPVLDPRTPFAVHTCPGTALTIRTPQGDLPGAAFAGDDSDLSGYLVLDWQAFTQWQEEDELVLGHPHDPFDRIDCLRSGRHIVVSVSGQVLADTTAATLLFETPLPVRYYLPRENVRMDLLEHSQQQTLCAYKGVATYWSALVGDRHVRDIAWTYENPLHDAVPVKSMISFFTERVDISIDGVPLERPVTPWS